MAYLFLFIKLPSELVKQSSRTRDSEENPLFNLRVLHYDPRLAFKAAWLELNKSL